MSELLRSWHRVQKSASSCVGACRAIVEARNGWDGIEADAHGLIDGEWLHEDIVESIALLEARLKRGACAIVGVRGPAWMNLARDANRRSKYGDLGDGNHAVVLAGIVGRTFVVLDPYFETSDQPVQCTRDDFATAWTGEVRFYEAEMFSESGIGS